MPELQNYLALSYVPTWGLWEIIRELVSNSLDAGNEVIIFKQNNDLVIQDDGKGLQTRHFIMGVTEKQDTQKSIGKFGEGMKLALLVATRLNYKVDIYSNNKHYWNGQDVVDSIPVLKLFEESYSEPELGTRIVIHNWNDSPTFDTRFITKSDNRILFSCDSGDLLNTPELFVRGVFVQNLQNVAFGYNLKGNTQINRDRNIVDDYSRNHAAGTIWDAVNNVKLWEDFFKACRDGKSERDIHVHYDQMQESLLASELAFQSVFGEDVLIADSDRMLRESEHRGKKAINSSMFGYMIREVVAKVIGTAEDFVSEQIAKKSTPVKMSKLTPEQKHNLAIVKRVARKINFNPEQYLIVENLPNALGLCVANMGIIKVDPRALESKRQAISTFIHEVGHLNGSPDLTNGHVNSITDKAADIILALL